MSKRSYNKEHRTIPKSTTILEDQASWMDRNRPEDEFKSEAAFIQHLLSLGINEFQKQRVSDVHNGH